MPKVITKQAIREYRISLGLTQEEFAKDMGVSAWTVKSWEQPKNRAQPPKRLLYDPRTRHLATDTDNQE